MELPPSAQNAPSEPRTLNAGPTRSETGDIRRRFARFLVVGGLSTALNYGVYLLLLPKLPYLPAAAIGYLSGLVVGYFLNRAWAFDAATESHRKVVPFVLVYLVNLATSQLLLLALVDRLGVPASWANVPALGYTTIANFLGLHWFVFRRTAS